MPGGSGAAGIDGAASPWGDRVDDITKPVTLAVGVHPIRYIFIVRALHWHTLLLLHKPMGVGRQGYMAHTLAKCTSVQCVLTIRNVWCVVCGVLFVACGVYRAVPCRNRYTVSDKDGNTARCSTQVTILDEQTPVIKCPVIKAAYNTDAGKSTTRLQALVATASDNTGVDPAASYLATGARSYPIGTTRVRFVAVDLYGLQSQCEVVIAVKDMEPPVIACHHVNRHVFYFTPSGSETVCRAVEGGGLSFLWDCESLARCCIGCFRDSVSARGYGWACLRAHVNCQTLPNLARALHVLPSLHGRMRMLN